MTFQVHAADVKISDLLNSSVNPAKNITKISIGGLLKGNGLDVINFVFIIIGLIFFANLVMAGWGYITSSGDPKKVASATTRIINGLTGLVMAIVAFVVVRLISQILGLSGSTTAPVI